MAKEDPMQSAFDHMRHALATEKTARRVAELNYASASLDIARTDEAIALLLSRSEPITSFGVDRSKLRVILAYCRHHDLKRLERDIQEVSRDGE